MTSHALSRKELETTCSTSFYAFLFKNALHASTSPVPFPLDFQAEIPI